MQTTRNRSLREPSARAARGEPASRIPPGHRRPAKPRGRLGWLVAAALAPAVGLLLYHRYELPAALPSVRVAEVRSGTLERTIRLTGSTVAARSALLRAPYLRGRRSVGAGDFGLVLEELAPPGSQVATGDVVAAFDRMYMLNRLDNYRAAHLDRELRLRTLRAQQDVKRAAHRQKIRVAKARMDQAALDLKTAPVRSAIQAAVLELDFNEAKHTYEALLAQTRHLEAVQNAEVGLAELELEEASAELRRAEANVDRMIVRAPVNGLVVMTEIFRGSDFGQIRIGDQLRPHQPFAQIVDVPSMIVEARANQVDVERLRIGARARIRFDAYSALELPARVYSIGALAIKRGWRAAYVADIPVFLKFDRLDPRVIPNLTVSADVILRKERSDGIVPQEAVFHDGKAGQPFAYVRTPSGWQRRELQLGLANNINVAVRSGLTTGEAVALDEPSA